MAANKKEIKLRGVVAPVITVFNPDETVDEVGMLAHIRFLLDHGVQGLVIGGSSAEAVGMTAVERKRIAELTVSEFGSMASVCIATSAYRTKDSIELSQHAQAIGANSIMVIPPYYMGLTKKHVFAHYEAIASCVDLPILLYDNPGASGVVLDVSEIAGFFSRGLIQGVKLTLDRGDTSQVHELRYLCGPNLLIFYGADTCALEGLLCGADGWISTLINLIPKISRLFCDTALSGNRDEACAIWDKMLPLINFETYVDTDREPHWLSLVKSGLQALGYPVGKPRRPLLPLSEEHCKHLIQILSSLQNAVESGKP